MKYELYDWEIITADRVTGYSSPELVRKRLSGIRNGECVVTSPIKSVNGRRVTTVSGNTYILCGDPNPDYLEWMLDNDFVYDSENPIKTK